MMRLNSLRMALGPAASIRCCQVLPFLLSKLKTFGLVSGLFVIAGATLGLSYLFFLAEKKKFYPAMPFITTGIFAGMILSYFVL